MLSMVRSAARALSTTGLQVGPCVGEEGGLYVTVDLHGMLAPLPDLTWTKVAGACVRTAIPVYRVLCDTLHDDMEHVARLLAELELPAEENAPTAVTHAQSSQPERPPRKRRRSSDSVHPHSGADAQLVIPGSHPSIPTIVITPCPPKPHEAACLVPYQDAAYGARLTVPTHAALNSAFPPLVAAPVPAAAYWRYEGGHWRALLPDVDEQMARGMFSRPLATRRHRARVSAHAPCESAASRLRSFRWGAVG